MTPVERNDLTELQQSTVELKSPSPFAYGLDEITANFAPCTNEDELLHVSNALTRLVAADMEPQDVAQLLAKESHGVLPTHEHITSLFAAHPDYFERISDVEKRFFLLCGLSYGITALHNKQISQYRHLTTTTEEEFWNVNRDIVHLEGIREQVFQTQRHTSNLLGNNLGE